MPITRELTPPQGALAFCALLMAVLYTVAVQAACGCYFCMSGRPHGLMTGPDGDAYTELPAGSPYDGEGDQGEVPFAEFRIGNKWSSVGTPGGFSRRQGDPVTLTWGFVPDGTTLPSETQADGSTRRDPSDLIAFLDRWVGSRSDSAIPDITSKSWFPIFSSAYERWSELSGVTFNYEPNDDGIPISGSTAFSSRGRPGVRADMRVGGHFVDGQTGSNTLAYNYFPSVGDMVIDTSNVSFYAASFNNYLRLRNVVAHEIGHGLGFNHFESRDSAQLMEPFISTAFDGPQIADILAVHRNYGDVHEKDGGNDSWTSADEIGSFADSETWEIGVDGRSSVVSPSQTDFISIDDDSDRDYFTFTVEEPSTARIVMTQVGRAYFEGPQSGDPNDQVLLDAARLNELELELLRLDAGGVLSIAEGQPQTRAPGEQIEEVTLFPGEQYFLRVSGTENDVQLYDLRMRFRALPIPEPATALLVIATLVCSARRRSIG